MSLRWSTALLAAAVVIVGAVLWVSGVAPNITGVIFGGGIAASLIAGTGLWIAGGMTRNSGWREIGQGLVLGGVLGFVGGFVSCFALISNFN